MNIVEPPKSIKYLIVILEDNSTSFCHYENKGHSTDSALMSFELLEKTITYAANYNLSINFLFGNSHLPEKYNQAVKSSDHVKIVPIHMREHYDGAVYVIDSGNYTLVSEMSLGGTINIILRLEKDKISRLEEIVHSLEGRFKRLNLALLGIESYTDNELDEYHHQLLQIEKYAFEQYKSGAQPEMNFITDRIFLQKMNNCDAGIKHVTLALNGRFYICPGFYYDNKDNHIGDIGSGFQLKNAHLLTNVYSPVCRICDAFQCRRCIYLNKKTTLELNTPSRQQCILSHHERNASKRILDSLRPFINSYQRIPEISEIDYLDPFEIAKDLPAKEMAGEHSPRTSQSILPERLSERELLLNIFKMQKEILEKMNELNKKH